MRSWINRVPVIAALCGALLLPVSPPVVAQDTTQADGPFCSVLTVDEVKAAVGVRVKVAPGGSATSCTYLSAKDDGGTYYLTVSTSPDNLQYWKDFYGDLKDATVGDRAAAMAADGRLLFIDIGTGVLTLQMDGNVKGLDKKAAIKEMGAAALTHLDAVALPTPVPTVGPAPSFTGDADLLKLYPTQLGGQPLTVQTVSGAELAAMSQDPESLKPVEAVLAGLGKTLDDVSIGLGYGANGAITAVRIRGVDVTTILETFLPLVLTSIEEPVREPVEIAGRQVIKVTDGKDATTAPQYVLAGGEVIWMIVAAEPFLTEAIGALP